MTFLVAGDLVLFNSHSPFYIMTIVCLVSCYVVVAGAGMGFSKYQSASDDDMDAPDSVNTAETFVSAGDVNLEPQPSAPAQPDPDTSNIISQGMSFTKIGYAILLAS